MASIVACLLFSLVCPSAQAKKSKSRDAQQVRLRDLLDAATRHSPVLTRAYLAAEVADGDVLAADAAQAWQLAAGLSATLISSAPAEVAPTQTIQQQRIDSEVAVSKRLSTGGVVSLDVRAQNLRHSSVMPTHDAATTTTSAGIRVVQPLTRFRGQTREQLRSSQAQLVKEIALYQLESDAIDEVLRIASAYRLLAVAEEVLRIREHSLELAKRQLTIADAAVRSGVAAESEKSAVEQARYSREAAVVGAQLERMERSLQIRELVGMPIGPSDVLLRSRGLGAATDARGSLRNVLDDVAAGNPRLKVAELAVLLGDTGLRGAKQEARPLLDLQLAARAQTEGYELSAGLAMQWDVGGKRGRGLTKSARSQALSAKVSLAQTERAVNAEAVRAWSRVRGAHDQAEFANKAVEFAARNVDLEEKRFKAGDASSFDVLLRHDELANARIVALAAQLDLLDAGDRLAASTGELLANYDLLLDLETDY